MFALILFLITIGITLALSRKDIGLGLFVGALILGLILPVLSILTGVPYDLSPSEGGTAILHAFTDVKNILLALAVALIPLIGGTMEKTGQMDKLVNNLRLPKKATVSFLPAILGMLPMPGGALLSSPLVERTGKGVEAGDKAAINVYFRHILFLIYPLAPALLVSASVFHLNVYSALPYLAVFFILSILLGYVFLLRNVKGNVEYEKDFSFKGLAIPLLIILIAPLIDLLLKILSPRFTSSPLKELALLLGVTVSLSLAILVGHLKGSELMNVFKEMESWNFAFIIFGMYAFVYSFEASPISKAIEQLHISLFLFALFSFFLGVGTGRIQAPMGILSVVIVGNATPLIFSVVFFSVFLGYLLSPVHPCIPVSIEYLGTDLREFFSAILPPVGIAFGVVIIFSILFL